MILENEVEIPVRIVKDGDHPTAIQFVEEHMGDLSNISVFDMQIAVAWLAYRLVSLEDKDIAEILAEIADLQEVFE